MQNNFIQEIPDQQAIFTSNSLNKYNQTFSNNIQNPNQNSKINLIQDGQESKNIQEKSLYNLSSNTLKNINIISPTIKPDTQKILSSNNLNLNSNNIEKIHELLESKRILSTLRSIKSSNSINYEDIKLLPTLFLDMQEALKKSNANVLELKETIKEKIKLEKKLKEKIKEYENDNKKILDKLYKHRANENELKKKFDELKYENLNLNQNLEYNTSIKSKFENLIIENKNLKRENEELLKKVENYEDDLTFLTNAKTELEQKNKKYKNAQGFLQSELNSIEEHLEDVKSFQNEIKKMQREIKELKELNKKLENDKKKFSDENFNYINVIKEMKTELKNLLTEKMVLLKDTKENKEKNISLITELEKNLDDAKLKNENLINDIQDYESLKIKYTELNEDYNKIMNENSELREQAQEKKFSEKEVNALQEKYETESFILKSEVNIWKNTFLEIAIFKLVNYDKKVNQEIEEALHIDENYLINAPNDIKENAEKILEYYKQLIERQNYKTINLKQLKEAFITEQQKVFILSSKLKNEKYLRRKIHNRYMYLRGNLRVMCRIRPFLPTEIINKKSQMETIIIQNDSISINEENKPIKNFEFDYIFDSHSTQEDVYEEVTLLIQSMVQGNNICIIAYGQTCTGKTYTIQGPDHHNPGIATRAAKELFEILGSSDFKKLYISTRLTLTIIEIYNEQIFNLLEENTPNLALFENANGNLEIPDLNPIAINNFGEASKLFKLASKFRHTSCTEYNDRSSRSHCIFSFQLKLTDKDGKIMRSTLHIIDLAGSERISKSKQNDEKTRKEAISINLSLHSLSNVLNSIANKSSHIPYRDSKLTHFLKDSLNENYNILLLLHLSPQIKDLPETISTLQFGERIVKICHHKTGKEKIQFINAAK